MAKTPEDQDPSAAAADGAPQAAPSLEPIRFPRPGLTVYGNLLATLLFAITGMLYFLSERTVFGIGWWLIAALWLRRYFWARKTALIELSEREILINVGPRRVRSYDLQDIRLARYEDDKVILRLDDDSRIKFSGFELRKEDMSTFFRLLQARRKALAPAENGSDDEG